MAGSQTSTEDWRTLSWKTIHKNVFRLQCRIYQAARRNDVRRSRSTVLMTTARILKSRIRRKSYVRFGSGGGVGDGPAGHNLGRPPTIHSQATPLCIQ
jgi:hypothetical protein